VNEETVENSPKVSIISVTYNHEAYIREALDGFIAQETNFPVEIIVADDASTDSTPTIIREYANQHPHLFRPILRSTNVGVNANTTEALSAARGEYLAMCDGDDYWTDPTKLSKQVAFLDRHPETAVCFHPVRTVWTAGSHDQSNFVQESLRTLEGIFFPTFPPFFWAGDLSVEALISQNFIQTNSVMFRRLPRYDDIPADVMPLDWFLQVRHAATGGIAMLAETMAVYRRHPQGIWYDAAVNPAKFWLAYGPGHVATLEAILDLFPNDPVRETIIAKTANSFLSRIARNVPGPEGHALLTDIVAQHPRIATLALRHRSTQTPGTRVRSTWRAVAAAARGLRAGERSPAGDG
jgi:glycosyltransferase involved in cell wall biosynthesis